MTPEEKRIAIVEACGWTKKEVLTGSFGNPEKQVSRGLKWHDPNGFQRDVPDYLNDLNAMAEAVKTLNCEQREVYTEHLRKIVQRDCRQPECYVPGAERAQLISPFWFYEATAAQRANAFLKTLGVL